PVGIRRSLPTKLRKEASALVFRQ
ncbi:uncharacterized protein METZ01_LOCUS369201, partial [marine metagenome]